MKTFKEFIVEAKRVKILRTAHYTNRDSRSKILSGGFKDSPSTGAYHPDDNKRTVYTTPSSRVGNDYGYSRVNLKLVNPKITTTNSPAQFNNKVKELVNSQDDNIQQKARAIHPTYQSKKAISDGSKVVRAPNAHEMGGPTGPKGSYIMVDKDLANKSIDRNPQPTIKASNKPQRSKIKARKKVDEGWIPPASKKLRGGTKSPLSVAREKGTDVEKVRRSVHRFAEPINDPKHSDYDYNKNDKGQVTLKSKKHPIQVSYTPGDEPNSFVQNSKTTGEVSDRISAGRSMQRMKELIASSARPGTKILSQPVGERRAKLNTRSQGMGPTNEKGVQGGVVRHRSPKQKQKGSKPMDPVQQKGIFIDH